MNAVEPIRDTRKIKEIKDDLLKQSYRNYMMFLVGINTGLRVGDLLRLKVDDIRDKKHIIIKEQKTLKNKQFLINKVLRQELTESKHTG
jgi:integrase